MADVYHLTTFGGPTAPAPSLASCANRPAVGQGYIILKYRKVRVCETPTSYMQGISKHEFAGASYALPNSVSLIQVGQRSCQKLITVILIMHRSYLYKEELKMARKITHEPTWVLMGIIIIGIVLIATLLISILTEISYYLLHQL